MVFRKTTLKDLYKYKQNLFSKFGVDKLCHFLLKTDVTPNKISILNQFIGLLSVFFLFNNTFLFTLFLIINKFLDIFDGYFARSQNLESSLGDKIDHWGDLGLSILFLTKTILYLHGFLPIFALGIYIGEYILLKKEGMLKYKFPSGIFIIFFIFGLYQLGLWYQIIYQVVSYIYFEISIKSNINLRKSHMSK